MVQVHEHRRDVGFKRRKVDAAAEGDRFQVVVVENPRKSRYAYEVVDTTLGRDASAIVECGGADAGHRAIVYCREMNRRGEPEYTHFEELIAGNVSRPATPGPSVDASTNALATDLAAS